jgi:hypothetical protein
MRSQQGTARPRPQFRPEISRFADILLGRINGAEAKSRKQPHAQ